MNTEKDEEKKKMKKIKQEKKDMQIYTYRKETITEYLLRSFEVFYRDAISEVVPFFIAAVSQTKIDDRNLRIRNCPESVDCASAR